MPKRYIDAELLKSEIENTYIDGDSAIDYHASADGDTLIGKFQVLDIIFDQPAADVEEVRHGEWIDDVDDVYWGNYIVKQHCSRCGFTPHFDREKELFDLSRYCPNCGANMDRRDNSDDR